MPVPKDVTVTRQVLAEPDAGLAERTWATLADGTPLVTARAPRQGNDRAVSCHRRHALVRPAAVRRLRRHAPPHRRARRHRDRAHESSATAADADRSEVVPPTRILDGFGAFGTAAADGAAGAGGFIGRATADHPPGFYGPPEGLARRQHAGARRPARRRSISRRSTRGSRLIGGRAAGPARADPARRAGAARARRAGGVLAAGGVGSACACAAARRRSLR